MTTRSGLVFVAETPDSFRGRVDFVKSTNMGASYVAVSDGSRLVLLRATPVLEAMQGKFNELTRDARGHVQARLAPDRDLGRQSFLVGDSRCACGSDQFLRHDSLRPGNEPQRGTVLSRSGLPVGGAEWPE